MVSEGIANPSKMLKSCARSSRVPSAKKGDNMKKVYKELKIEIININSDTIKTSEEQKFTEDFNE